MAIRNVLKSTHGFIIIKKKCLRTRENFDTLRISIEVAPISVNSSINGKVLGHIVWLLEEAQKPDSDSQSEERVIKKHRSSSNLTGKSDK